MRNQARAAIRVGLVPPSVSVDNGRGRRRPRLRRSISPPAQTRENTTYRESGRAAYEPPLNAEKLCPDRKDEAGENGVGGTFDDEP
jgi:hypothetical protein